MSRYESQKLKEHNQLITINSFRKSHGLEPIIQKTRNCLKCNIEFDSQGQSNRMCYKCKDQTN